MESNIRHFENICKMYEDRIIKLANLLICEMSYHQEDVQEVTARYDALRFTYRYDELLLNGWAVGKSPLEQNLSEEQRKEIYKILFRAYEKEKIAKEKEEYSKGLIKDFKEHIYAYVKNEYISILNLISLKYDYGFSIEFPKWLSERIEKEPCFKDFKTECETHFAQEQNE